MPWPLAIVAMVLLLAGIYYYFRFVARLFGRLKAALRERGYKSPALQVGLAALAFVLPFAITLATLGYGHEEGIWLILGLFIALPLIFTIGARWLPRRDPRTRSGARRAAQPDAAAVMARDPRPPVVYLRPFRHEESSAPKSARGLGRSLRLRVE
jgi:hypothetical protein